MLSKEEIKKSLNELAEISCIRSYTSNELYKILSQFIDKHFELIEILKEVGWDGFNIGDLKTIIKAGQYNAEKLNSLRKPYKFEDLKEEMFVYASNWDNVFLIAYTIEHIETKERYVYGWGCRDGHLTKIKFEENRFFPVQMANVGCE